MARNRSILCAIIVSILMLNLITLSVNVSLFVDVPVNAKVSSPDILNSTAFYFEDLEIESDNYDLHVDNRFLHLVFVNESGLNYARNDLMNTGWSLELIEENSTQFDQIELASNPKNNSEVHIIYSARGQNSQWILTHATNGAILNQELLSKNNSVFLNPNSQWIRSNLTEQGTQIGEIDIEISQNGSVSIVAEYSNTTDDFKDIVIWRNLLISTENSVLDFSIIAEEVEVSYFDYEMSNGVDYIVWGGANTQDIMIYDSLSDSVLDSGFDNYFGMGDLEVIEHAENSSEILYIDLYEDINDENQDGFLYLNFSNNSKTTIDYCLSTEPTYGCSYFNMGYVSFGYQLVIGKDKSKNIFFASSIRNEDNAEYYTGLWHVSFNESSSSWEYVVTNWGISIENINFESNQNGDIFGIYTNLSSGTVNLMTSSNLYQISPIGETNVLHSNYVGQEIFLNQEIEDIRFTFVENFEEKIESLGKANHGTCLINSTFGINCVGYNNVGQLGDNSQTSTGESPPTNMWMGNFSSNPVYFGGSTERSCVLTQNGDVFCMGNNNKNSVGVPYNESSTRLLSPTKVENLSGIELLSVGEKHSCGLNSINELYCWGGNEYGQIGNNNSSSDGELVTKVNFSSSLGTIIDVQVGGYTSCVLSQNSTAYCWGYFYGTGQNVSEHTFSPREIIGTNVENNVKAISTSNAGTCILLRNNSVSCVGSKVILGDGSVSSPFEGEHLVFDRYVNLPNEIEVLDLIVRGQFACAHLANNSIACWGDNQQEQLGIAQNGQMHFEYEPVYVEFQESVTIQSLHLGINHGCILDDENQIWCWGEGAYGEKGNQNTASNHVPTISNFGGFTPNTQNRSYNLTKNVYDATCFIYPSLPKGLTQNPQTCTISGAPEEIVENTTFTVYAQINNEYYTTEFWLDDDSLDTDGDGIVDSEDECINEFGNSTIDRIGCPDSDGDGWSDLNDDFPADASEYRDTDGDQVGDNSDAFPYNPSEWQDTDEDGVGDNADDFPYNASETTDSDGDGYGDNSDQFPFNGLEHTDSDGDGIGDNSDEFPLLDNNVNSDSDNYSDVYDAFPLDSTQWEDIDGDGYGDNLDGNSPDIFSNLSTQWSDFDQDGYGDNWGNASWNESRYSFWPGIFVEGAEYPDYCPTVSGNSSLQGVFGCEDSDGDGLADFLQEQIVEDNENENNITDNTNQTDSDNDGVIDSMDLCNGTSVILSVDENGCPLDFDGDGVFDEYDKCPFSSQNALVNEEGCEEESPQSSSFFEALRSGEQSAVVRTIGLTSLLIAILGFLQTNAVAAALPESLKWMKVLNRNYRLTKEEEFELSHLMSLVITYHEDSESLKEELFNLKADISSRFANKEISKKTKEVLFSYIDDILLMNQEQIKKVALSETFYGLRGATKKEKRLDDLSKSIVLNADESYKPGRKPFEPTEESLEHSIIISEEDNSPPYALIGVMHESGYEVLEYPEGSGKWWWKNDLDKVWQVWE